MEKLPFALEEGEKFLKDAPLVIYEGADTKGKGFLGVNQPKTCHAYLTDQRLVLFGSKIGMGGKEGKILGLLREIPLSSITKITPGVKMVYNATIEMGVKSADDQEETVVLTFVESQARQAFPPAFGVNPDAMRTTAKRADERDQFFEEIREHSPLIEKRPVEKSAAPAVQKQAVTADSGKVLQYKRTCQKCGKVWYSLVEREEKMESGSKSNPCLNVCSSMFFPCKIILVSKAKKGQTLDKLRKCPNCQSPAYTEEKLAYDEKG